MKSSLPDSRIPSLKSMLEDDRFRNFLWQFIFFILIVFLLGKASSQVISALRTRGMMPSFKFLTLSSGIVVGEKLIEFDSSSSNLRALMVGLLNTISISLLVIVFSSVFGLFVAICRISSNWLVSNIAKAYIEIIRNIPLLLLLLVWYRAFFLQMPGIKNAIMLGKTVSNEGVTKASLILSNRGLFLAWPTPTEPFVTYRFILLGATVAALVVWIFLRIRSGKTGKKALGFLWATLAFLAIAAAGWLSMGANHPLRLDFPRLGKFNANGGLYISSEWFSLFSGLVLYTSAFVAEAFRAGIQGVPKGQMEAARALGLGHLRSLRLIVIPQAKIVAIPPLTSIFLGVAKNTSLGVAIGFPDLFSITGTIINQTGRALEMIILVMAIYLLMSTATSLFMNWYNKRVQLIEH
jgi:general L-amino acid transport system permease protein